MHISDYNVGLLLRRVRAFSVLGNCPATMLQQSKKFHITLHEFYPTLHMSEFSLSSSVVFVLLKSVQYLS